jgi:hypothetical protein
MLALSSSCGLQINNTKSHLSCLLAKIAMGCPKSQTPSSPDRDALVALDALLRIRESGALDSAMANNNASITNGKPSSLPLETYATKSIDSPPAASSLSHPFPASLSSLLHHHVAMEASVAHYRLAAAQAAAATSWGNSLLATNAPHASRNGPTDAAISASSTPAGADDRMVASGATKSPDRETILEDSAIRKRTESNEFSVRQEKVEEALRSKPQRGRKRDDLSATERLELTRTRNREHAKCTR